MADRASEQTGRPTVCVPRSMAMPGPDEPAWAAAATIAIDRFHPRGAGGPVRTSARLLHDGSHRLFVRFDVTDEPVVARHLAANADVCQDSCVEAFFSPPGVKGHFNVEVNAIGTPLLMHVIDPSPAAPGARWPFAEARVFDPAVIDACVQRRTSLPAGRVIDPPTPPRSWRLELAIDLAGILADAGVAFPGLAGTTWRGNFYKCADAGPIPHWAAWSDVGPRLWFHQPARFGTLHFT